MTIYIHCGAHKTASQFTKEFLRTNRELFNLNGIGIHLDKFYARKEVSATKIIELVEQNLQNNYQHTVISEDANVIGLMPGIFTAKKQNFFDPKSIMKFSNAIDQVHQKYEIKFLMCVRQQDSYIESCYKFRKAHGATYSFEYFMDKSHEINFSWFNIIDTVAQHIGQKNCIVTPYELLKKSQSEFISTFLKPILEIDCLQVVFPHPRNLGASELLMSVINYFDQEFSEIPVQHRQKILSIIRQYKSSRSSKISKSSKISLLSDLDRRNILDKYALDNQKLFAKYIPVLPTNYYDYEFLDKASLELVL